MKIKNYKLGFSLTALVLFALIMLPNIIWAFVPSQNDILRSPSTTQLVDVFATIFQVIMLSALCTIKNENADKLEFSLFIILSAFFGLLYYICWVLYYCGIVHKAVLLGLCIFPCCAFLFYAIDRKNWIALAPLAVFTILHLISTIINFII